MPPARKQAAKKATAKKVTAKKTAAAPKSGVSWSLDSGKYLSTASISRNSVSAGAPVEQLRAALGLGGGVFDAEVRRAVIAAQEAADVTATGVVTEADWDLIVNGSAPAPAGGVDGADETDDPTGELDTPEGAE